MQNEEEKIQKIAEHLIIMKKEIDEMLDIINLKVSKEFTRVNSDDSKEYFEDDSKIIEGLFNGEVMIGPDQKQYSIPANYISKSKIVEGDKLKLTIKRDGTFVYKQIEPIERVRLVGILTKDETQKGFLVLADGKLYKAQKASVTYFKGEYGDTATILVPKDRNSAWAAIENISKMNNQVISENKENEIIKEEIKVEEYKEPVKENNKEINKKALDENNIIKEVIKTEKKEIKLSDIKPIRLEDLK